MTLRIDTSSLSAIGREAPAVTTNTKTKKPKFIEFPKTQEPEQAIGSTAETKNKKSVKKAMSDDELLDMSSKELFEANMKTVKKKLRETNEKEWKENIKNAKTPEEKAKQKEIYDSRMNYKKAVIEHKKSSMDISHTSKDKIREDYKKYKKQEIMSEQIME